MLGAGIAVFILGWPIFLLYLQKRRKEKRIAGLEHQMSVQSRERNRIEQQLYLVKTTANEALDLLNRTKSGEGHYTLKAKQLLGEILKSERYAKILRR